MPRLRIAHTSEERIGQIYVPWINWALLTAVLALVFTFRSSAALAYAFGMAVTGTITIATLLFFYVVRYQWGKPLWLVVPGAFRAGEELGDGRGKLGGVQDAVAIEVEPCEGIMHVTAALNRANPYARQAIPGPLWPCATGRASPTAAACPASGG